MISKAEYIELKKKQHARKRDASMRALLGLRPTRLRWVRDNWNSIPQIIYECQDGLPWVKDESTGGYELVSDFEFTPDINDQQDESELELL